MAVVNKVAASGTFPRFCRAECVLPKRANGAMFQRRVQVPTAIEQSGILTTLASAVVQNHFKATRFKPRA